MGFIYLGLNSAEYLPVFPFLRNIIDVSAADSQGMEQHEYMDKARQYRWVCGGSCLMCMWVLTGLVDVFQH